ncbi:hypothetical protein R1flu_024711 [Riccia fluitans]|uniref:Uncharacterized protein n=1 Tax=Riccia fluitans TaxID=41844 RepID=A0ABD1XW56_9MARC
MRAVHFPGWGQDPEEERTEEQTPKEVDRSALDPHPLPNPASKYSLDREGSDKPSVSPVPHSDIGPVVNNQGHSTSRTVGSAFTILIPTRAKSSPPLANALPPLAKALPVEAKSGRRGDALAATSPPLAKLSSVEAKAGYSWRSPSQGFASTGESFANGGKERKMWRCPSRHFASTSKAFASGGEGRLFLAKP